MKYLLLYFLFWQETQPIPTVGFFDVMLLIMQTVIALAIVCGLAVLVFRYILPKLNAVTFNESIVKVVDGTSLDARKRLIIVKTAGKYMLLATSESGVQLISELDGTSVENAVAELEKTKSEGKKSGFTEVLDRYWQKKR